MSPKSDHALVGSLAALDGAYTYRRRGTRQASFPDLAPEEGATSGSIPFSEGNLFRPDRRVAWRGTGLYDVGVDIAIDLRTMAFVDRVIVEQDGDAASAVAAVEVLVSDDAREGFRPAGRVGAGPGGEIRDGRIVVPVGLPARALVVRLHACFRNIVLRGVDIFGATLDLPFVFPQPKRCVFGPGRAALVLERLKGIAIANGAGDDARFAATLLAEKLGEDFGVKTEVASAASAKSLAGRIALGLSDEMSGLTGTAESAPKAEGYRLVSDGKSVRLVASDRRGLIYGVETLLSLLREKPEAPAIPACTIEDEPAMAWRGAHFGVPPREEIPFVKRLIRYVLAPMRINTLFLEIAAGMQFDSHPEVNEAWLRANEQAERGEAPAVPHGNMIAGGGVLTKDEVRDLAEYARAYGLEVIPEVQSLSHVQFLTITYPEIAEIPAKKPRAEGETDIEKADEKPPEKYPHCYCPSHEKSYRIIYDLIDEIVEVVRPQRYVHMGHDEVYVIGVCERCKDKTPADLFALHVNKMHEHLKRKGLGMMIWADMLHSCTQYQTPPAIDRIPKDIILLDFIWYFHTDKDIEDHLLAHGFQVIMGNMYSSHYPRYESRRLKKGMIGAEVSTWVREDEYVFAREGKIYDFIYSGNMMWSADYREDLRLTYDRAIVGMMPRIRERLHGAPYPSLSAKRKCVPLVLEGKVTKEDEPEMCEVRGVPFYMHQPLAVQSKSAHDPDYPDEVRIPVGRKFDSLVFLHATQGNAERIPWRNLVCVGTYVVEYADGRSVKAPIEYGGNIAAWDRRHAEPMPHPMYRHEGYIGTYLADPFVREKTATGGDLTVYGYEWLNPRPNVAIRGVRLIGQGPSDVAVALFALTGVKAK